MLEPDSQDQPGQDEQNLVPDEIKEQEFSENSDILAYFQKIFSALFGLNQKDELSQTEQKQREALTKLMTNWRDNAGLMQRLDQDPQAAKYVQQYFPQMRAAYRLNLADQQKVERLNTIDDVRDKLVGNGPNRQQNLEEINEYLQIMDERGRLMKQGRDTRAQDQALMNRQREILDNNPMASSVHRLLGWRQRKQQELGLMQDFPNILKDANSGDPEKMLSARERIQQLADAQRYLKEMEQNPVVKGYADGWRQKQEQTKRELKKMGLSGVKLDDRMYQYQYDSLGSPEEFNAQLMRSFAEPVQNQKIKANTLSRAQNLEKEALVASQLQKERDLAQLRSVVPPEKELVDGMASRMANGNSERIIEKQGAEVLKWLNADRLDKSSVSALENSNPEVKLLANLRQWDKAAELGFKLQDQLIEAQESKDNARIAQIQQKIQNNNSVLSTLEQDKTVSKYAQKSYDRIDRMNRRGEGRLVNQVGVLSREELPKSQRNFLSEDRRNDPKLKQQGLYLLNELERKDEYIAMRRAQAELAALDPNNAQKAAELKQRIQDHATQLSEVQGKAVKLKDASKIPVKALGSGRLVNIPSRSARTQNVSMYLGRMQINREMQTKQKLPERVREMAQEKSKNVNIDKPRAQQSVSISL